MFSEITPPIITDSGPFYYGNEISLTIRRLDLTDPITGGNKWYKLQYNLLQFKKKGFKELVTFGGAFSNHVAAVARTCKLEGINCIGIIRGEPESIKNTTLQRAANDGMKLIFVSRSDYRRKEDPEFLQQLLTGYNESYILPEGGSNKYGVMGCMNILQEKDAHFSHIAIACGTGATATGMIHKLKPNQHLIGFSVLRDGFSLEKSIQDYLSGIKPDNLSQQWHIEHDFHFGGYAKTNDELTNFVNDFYIRTAVQIEPVYTGKLFYGLEHLINSGAFEPGSKILAIHTGGLQYLQPD